MFFINQVLIRHHFQYILPLNVVSLEVLHWFQCCLCIPSSTGKRQRKQSACITTSRERSLELTWERPGQSFQSWNSTAHIGQAPSIWRNIALRPGKLCTVRVCSLNSPNTQPETSPSVLRIGFFHVTSKGWLSLYFQWVCSTRKDYQKFLWRNTNAKFLNSLIYWKVNLFPQKTHSAERKASLRGRSIALLQPSFTSRNNYSKR